MKLLSNSIWIFSIIVLLLAISAFYPLPGLIMCTTFLGTGLVVLQAVIILKDDSRE